MWSQSSPSLLRGHSSRFDEYFCSSTYCSLRSEVRKTFHLGTSPSFNPHLLNNYYDLGCVQRMEITGKVDIVKEK